MARPYLPLAIWNYTPVLHSMPALEINSPTDPPTVCLEISVELIPYLLGLLEIYRWSDKFSGTPEQVINSLGVIQDLIVILTEGNCSEDSVTIFRFTEECGLEFSNSGGDMWTAVPGWAEFAEICFKGDQGIPGETGSTGAPGEDCECNDPTPTQPPVVVGDDRCQQACNIATGLARWLHGAHNDSLVFTKQAFEAGAIILDAVSDYIDFFPVFGALVNATVDLLTHWKDLDLGALIGVNDNAFREEIQCELYRIMADDTEDFTAEYLFQVREELQDWAALLPPRGPLVAFIGQSFALFLEQVQAQELLRRANVYKDSDSNCDLCDVECGDDECNAEICRLGGAGNDGTYSEAYGGAPAASYESDDAWHAGWITGIGGEYFANLKTFFEVNTVDVTGIKLRFLNHRTATYSHADNTVYVLADGVQIHSQVLPQVSEPVQVEMEISVTLATLDTLEIYASIEKLQNTGTINLERIEINPE